MSICSFADHPDCWLPISLHPGVDGLNRLLHLSDGRDLVGKLADTGWQVRVGGYMNPSRELESVGGVRRWSAPYETKIFSQLPKDVLPTHFRPLDSLHGSVDQ